MRFPIFFFLLPFSLSLFLRREPAKVFPRFSESQKGICLKVSGSIAVDGNYEHKHEHTHTGTHEHTHKHCHEAQHEHTHEHKHEHYHELDHLHEHEHEHLHQHEHLQVHEHVHAHQEKHEHHHIHDMYHHYPDIFMSQFLDEFEHDAHSTVSEPQYPELHDIHNIAEEPMRFARNFTNRTTEENEEGKSESDMEGLIDDFLDKRLIVKKFLPETISKLSGIFAKSDIYSSYESYDNAVSILQKDPYFSGKNPNPEQINFVLDFLSADYYDKSKK